MISGIKKHILTEEIPPNIPRTAVILGNTIEMKQNAVKHIRREADVPGDLKK